MGLDNDNEFINNDKILNELADKVFQRIMDRFSDIYPLNILSNEEEIIASELARLYTVLSMLEEKEEYLKAKIIYNKIRRLERKLEQL
mgnify:FL=1|jgi:uncharacterized protein YqgQ|tara:strand:- start:111 stop:374 length:264 start_codon:yes stop_codon:yes gene_type:complete